MRLINTRTLQLEKFNNHKGRPPYAILSHRWVEGEEVTFHDMQHPHRKWMPGWRKIAFCCEQALKEGLEYAWVDTCCINQDSSSELSEAINSMYRWYSDAVRCYAYLNDVNHPADAITTSTWFTRAWTLQELIAPTDLVFYDVEFNRIGEKKDFTTKIQQRTYIPSSVLLDPDQFNEVPVAVRMSWASHREATRTEDIAYSLFGLFEVNMPLLYGEGQRAFIRLQEEIIRQSNDHSIFIWHSLNEDDKSLPILAPTPEHFRTCQDIVSLEDPDTKPYAMTNVGLEIELQLHPYHLDTYVALLNCRRRETYGRYGILLAREGGSHGQWYRTRVGSLDVVTLSSYSSEGLSWQKMHIMKTSFKSEPSQMFQTSPFYGIKVNAPMFLDWSTQGVRPYAVVAYNDWEVTSMTATEREVDPRRIEESPKNTTLLSPTSFRHLSQFFTQKVPAKMLPTKASRKRRRSSDSNSVDGETTLQPTVVGTFEMPTMTTGISGAIFFDHLVHGIRAIKVGFDFDFRPVVYLATHAAGNDSQLQSWMRQWRFKHMKEFESSAYLLRDLRDDDDTRHFWKVKPDLMRTHKIIHRNHHGDDLPILIHDGVYGLRSTGSANADHWTFKPYEDDTWHIALSLEKRVIDDQLVWELTVERKDQEFELNIEISAVD